MGKSAVRRHFSVRSKPGLLVHGHEPSFLFRPGTYGLDRFVVKRYVEQVLSQCDRWRQLSPFVSSSASPLRTYTLTPYEVEHMQRIVDFHLNDTLHMRITASTDQLIEYDDLLDFIRRVQDSSRVSSNQFRPIAGKKTGSISIPSIHSSYVLPPSAKSMMPPLPSASTPKTSPVKPILAKSTAPPMITMPSSQPNKASTSSTVTNGHSASTRLSSTVHVKSSLISPAGNSSSSDPFSHGIRVLVGDHPTSAPPPSSLSDASELSPSILYHAKIDGSGWVQINNVFLPFVIKNRQRLVPYQVLVSCKILETDELRCVLTRATLADVSLMNQMIRECKINNEEIVENAPLINIYHVLIGTKNLVYVKVLPKDNPTSKINRQYKSVLALRGGSLSITYRNLPFVCSSNHSYIPLNDVLTIYPHLHIQLKPLARVPRTHEMDYLQLVQIYFDEKDLPLDTLLIDMEDLNQRQIIPSKNMTLTEYHAREKGKLEQQIGILTSSTTSKRKSQEVHESRPKLRPSPSVHPSSQHPASSSASPAVIRPPTGYFPSQPTPSSSSASSTSSAYPPQYQQNHWLSSNYEQRGRTR